MWGYSMNFLNRILGRTPTSGEIAKQRLQLVLVHDRVGISPQLIEILKDELIAVISKHVVIDEADMEITFSQGRHRNRLVADIPVVGIRRPRAADK
jgi:cell division topological specificity factor